MNDEYYLVHGMMLDSEHDSLDSAVKRANNLMGKYGLNHAMIKIGCRDDSKMNDIILIYCKLAKYPIEEAML